MNKNEIKNSFQNLKIMKNQMSLIESDEYDIVMSEIGFGHVHLYALFTNGFLQMLAIQETMGMAIVGPAAGCSMNMSMDHQSSIMAAPFLGAISSLYFWGYITDILGRRWVLLHTILICTVLSITSMFMHTFSSFFLMRFLTGILVAGPSSIAMTYLSEFCAKHLVSRILAFMFMFNGLAMIYCPGMAHFLIKDRPMDVELNLSDNISIQPWRLLGCTYALPGIIAFLLLLYLPESPKFLMMIGEKDRAIEAMNWICHKQTGRDLNEHQIKLMNNYYSSNIAQRGDRHGNPLRMMLDDAMPLFRYPYVELFICSCIVMFGLGLIANGLGLWFSDMRNRHYDDRNVHQTLCNRTYGKCSRNEDDFILEQKQICLKGFNSFNESILLGVTYIMLYKFLGLLLHFLSRKTIFVCSLLVASSCGFSLVVITEPFSIVICFLIFLALPGVMMHLLGTAILEFIPTHLRAKAICICLMWCRFGCVVGSTIVGYCMMVHCYLTLVIIASSPLVSASIQSLLPL